MPEALVHNPSNPITVGIWREHAPGGGTRIRKVISGTRAQTHPDWSASHSPSHWAFWRREAHVYEEDLQHVYASSGLRGPTTLAVNPLPDGSVELLLEDVRGRSGPALTSAELVEVARRLGCAQGHLAQAPVARPWLSSGFLADHIRSKHVDPAVLDDDAAWSNPLIRSTWSPGLRDGLHTLWADRHRLLQLARRLPRTLAHLDVWSQNLVAGDPFVLLDWSTVGDGHLGEDVSNLVIEAVLDGYLAAEHLEEIGRDALGAYVEGARTSGWMDATVVERGFHVAAVKWCWLGLLHLERACTGEHHLYGGAVDPHPEVQYRERGRALEQIVTWAQRGLSP